MYLTTDAVILFFLLASFYVVHTVM